jgi:hypothetical protein
VRSSTFDPEVAGTGVRDDAAWIALKAEALTYEFVETELFGASHFDDPIDRSANGNPSKLCSNILAAIGWMITCAKRTVVPSLEASA